MNCIFGNWTPVWADQGHWTRDDEIVSRALYEIQFSEKKQRYRLKCSGDHPKRHGYYAYAIRVLDSFNKNLEKKKIT